MDAQNSRGISVLHNGIQLAGMVSGTNIIYLQDKAGNTILGTDVNGVWYGTALLPSNSAVTATVDGLTTGLIPTNSKFVTVTSSVATKIVTLPAISASTIGQQIKIYVVANGYTLETPAASNNTINGVDADGTNQLDVAANTMLVATQVSATNWSIFTVAATTITVVAPDND